MPAQFLSCDWGTSSFRLRLVSTEARKIIFEVETNEGARPLFEERRPTWARPDLFAEVMRKHLVQLAAKHTLDGVPLLVSGMASSTIGWHELPYAKVPFDLDARGLIVHEMDWDAPDGLGCTFLISGVATDSDVMRGEECQALGLLANPAITHLRRRCVLVLPGTHSKHIFVENASVTGFQTYMTGELFATIGKQTILSASVDLTNAADNAQIHWLDFQAGVQAARELGLAAALFKVRARDVLLKWQPRANAAFLNGLLIGSETSELIPLADRPIVVAANEPVLGLYGGALDGHRNVTLISDVDHSTITGHRLVLSRLYDEL